MAPDRARVRRQLVSPKAAPVRRCLTASTGRRDAWTGLLPLVADAAWTDHANG